MRKEAALPTQSDQGLHFWYQKSTLLILLASLFVVVQALSCVIPPFQSPDESFHLGRAYLLSKGRIFLGNNGQVSGGNVDIGLSDYIDVFRDQRWFPYDEDKRRTRDPRASLAKEITWTGTEKFFRAPNVANYFPLPYAPQAAAIAIGESTGMTVANSYRLARTFSLLATLGILGIALLTYPVPPFVCALFVMPMTLFQMSSVSLDPVSFSLCVLTGALFMRGTNLNVSFTRTMHFVLAICLFSLATCRLNLVPFTLLLAVLYRIRRSFTYLVSWTAVSVLSFSWIICVFETIKEGGTLQVRSDLLTNYMSHPTEFFHVLSATLGNTDVLKGVWYMFIGAMGWSEITMSGGHFDRLQGIFLDPGIYFCFGILLALMALLSVKFGVSRSFGLSNASLLIGATLSALCIFLALLVMWTPPPAKVIIGVQGRYFIPSAIFVGFALFNNKVSPTKARLAVGLLFIMAATSIMAMGPRLLEQYWVTPPL